MGWKSIEQFNLPDHYNCFWRYEFDDGDIRYFCHEIQMTRLDMKTRRMGWIKAVYFIDPKEIEF